MRHLLREFIRTLIAIYSEVRFIRKYKNLIMMLDAGIPLFVIADRITRSSKIGVTPDELRSFMKIAEDLGYNKDTSELKIVLQEFGDYVKLLWNTFLSLFTNSIVSMGRYQEVLDKINAISSLKETGNKVHEKIVVTAIDKLYVDRSEYEEALGYLAIVTAEKIVRDNSDKVVVDGMQQTIDVIDDSLESLKKEKE